MKISPFSPVVVVVVAAATAAAAAATDPASVSVYLYKIKGGRTLNKHESNN